jgi:hypothetical protein
MKSGRPAKSEWQCVGMVSGNDSGSLLMADVGIEVIVLELFMRKRHGLDFFIKKDCIF